MEWFVWNEETEREYPGKHCEYCKNPIKIDDAYYLLTVNPFTAAHVVCYSERSDQPEGIQKGGKPD